MKTVEKADLKTQEVSQESESVLMERAQAGDRSSYATLFQRISDRIWRMASLLLHDSNAADDVVQETFTRGLDRIDTFRGESEPRTWFSTIALNVCRQVMRNERLWAGLAEPRVLEEARKLSRTRARGVLTSVYRHEGNRTLAAALKYLTQAQREAFVLHYADDMPYEEIGQVLGVSPGAARILAFRAKVALRGKLTPESGTQN